MSRASVLSRPLVTSGVLVGLAATVATLAYPVVPFAESREGFGVVSATTDDGRGVINTSSGPLTPADRDFLKKVRLAGLWELPSGTMAQVQTQNAAVRTAGKHLIDGHKLLDRDVVQVAQNLGVALPNEPNSQQQGWLAQLKSSRDGAFDENFANLLRNAHGKVFPLVAETRSKTQNQLVRALADRANYVVLDHMGMLEQTGRVDFNALTR
ncbi:DUF4142 domain-containing protein [Streptomyces sp. NPDC059917]|uniref:DUF4142 domain-containing protein n=1 Tax=Streptomyces sp. NPDC059917 TaxID=3347002 RepID=UPI00364924CF